MEALIGLGNPGESYRGHRHNAGWMLLEKVASTGRCLQRHSLQRVDLEEVRLGGRRLWLMRSRTFMNNSGVGVSDGCEELGLAPHEVLVAYDDVDLSIGRLRLRRTGGDGGHKGLRSVIKCLGTCDVPRLRLGIQGEWANVDTANYVLSDFEADEEEVVERMINSAVDAVEMILHRGFMAAMNNFNVQGAVQ